MDVEEQIRVFREFLEQNYYPQLLEGVRKGQKFLVIDFTELLRFNPELAEETLEAPTELLKAAELAVKEFDLPATIDKFTVRLRNLPLTQQVKINEIRSKHLNKFIWTEGIVRQKSDVRPHVTASRFECLSCGAIITIFQSDKRYRQPTRCSCGRERKFKEISKELIDGQGLVLEEAPDELEGGQPKRINVFLKDDLVSPISERKCSPGSRVRLYGWVVEVPVILQKGGQATKFDLIVEANCIEPTQEEDIDIQISEEELTKIKEIAAQPDVISRLAQNMAPSIYGHDKIKEALVLQLAGGCRKVRPDGITTRGDMHLLLIGDPGCIAGESLVALYHKGMKPIQSLGDRHGQRLREAVAVIRKNQHTKPYQFTSNFQIYPQQPTLRLVTETGKELICTYNHPLLTKEGWQRAEVLQVGRKIRVMSKIPNYIKRYKKTNFLPVKKSSGKLKENVRLPEKVTPSLASLFGYILGDGHVHKNCYRVFCYVNEEERDLLPLLQSLWKENFNVNCSWKRGGADNQPKEKVIREKKGVRKIVSTRPLYILEMNSRAVAFNLKFLAEKSVPPVIFESPLAVISAFLRWLFEADGYTFHTGRGKTSVQLKSASLKLLREVQLLLLYFGIQGRIIGDNLCIRRSRDLRLYAQKIGFVSRKKKKRLQRTIEGIAQKSSQQKRKTVQRYEKIAHREPYKVLDVYDLEVPGGHQFIANGIVSHNSAKSQLLKRISKIAPRARFTSGKGATAAGITASVVKDEFLGGWSLEAGTLVLANRGFGIIDEMDKMGKEDRSALHEAMEQQQVSISKANIQATLRCETTVIAAANPKLGRFDPYEDIYRQIDLPPTLINRFDLIFPIMDRPSRERDEEMASFILRLHQNPDAAASDIPSDLLKKYFAYVRQKINPVMTNEAIEELKQYYVSMRSSGLAEGGVPTVPITARQLEALVRLSEAAAKIRLSKTVTPQDAQKAIEMIDYCLNQIARDIKTGKIDIDRLSGAVPASQRSSIAVIKEIILALEEQTGSKVVAVENIVEAAREKNVKESEVTDILEKLRRSGDIFEPKRGYIQKL